MPPKLRILIGPSATGKSTYRKQLIASDPTWKHVNLDEIRLANPGLPEKDVQKQQLQYAEFFSKLLYNIVVDNTNLNPKTIEKWEQWAKDHNYSVEKVYFGTDLGWGEAVFRDSKRKESVGRSVIMQQYMQAGLFEDIKRQVVIIDLDGTLCNIDHRKHYVTTEGQKRNWKAFFSELHLDTINKPVELLYNMTVNHFHDVIFVSGRSSEYRKATEKWLKDHGIDDYHMLLMRGFNDKRDDAVVKQELYEKYIAPYYTVLFAVDDRPRILRMWQALGIFTFAVGDLQEF